MAILDAATGKGSSYARGISPGVIPAGDLVSMRFDAANSKRTAKWNLSNAITGSEGDDRGTPGSIDLDSKPKYALTAWQLAIGLTGMVGLPDVTPITAGKSWLLEFYPSRANDQRAVWEYLFRGSDAVGAITKYGHRVGKITMENDANKRVEVTEDWTDGLGDTISGLMVAKTGNTGTFAGRIMTRGRRSHSAAWDDGKSLYLKIVAKTPTTVNFVAGYDVRSTGDGSGFPAVAYDGAETVCTLPDSTNDTDGFSTVLFDAGPEGMYGEDRQPYQIGISGNDYDVFEVGDEFEIPISGLALTESLLDEVRLSAFHFDLLLSGTRHVHTQKCSVELDRPYKAFKPNGTRYAEAIDPSGNSTAVLKFDQRFFDTFLRDIQDANETMTVYAVSRDDAMIPDSAEHEGVELYIPQGRLETLDEGGGFSSADVLMSNVGLRAENPDTVAAGPTGFDGAAPWKVNITVGIDPTSFFV